MHNYICSIYQLHQLYINCINYMRTILIEHSILWYIFNISYSHDSFGKNYSTIIFIKFKPYFFQTYPIDISWYPILQHIQKYDRWASQAVSLCMHRALQLDPGRADAWHFGISWHHRWFAWEFQGENIENQWKKYGYIYIIYIYIWNIYGKSMENYGNNA